MPIEHELTGFALLQAIKHYLDPHNIMNPRKLGFGTSNPESDQKRATI
ncbi:MAG: FAD-linked oxidase C-terminal domain-containing protein [Candidatus Hermodarchaeota archaeon]|nr:FAD-linked oxidase C-terminal domain-containing protein [Candidatus Hermodarchaeota archaeon]